MEFRRAVNLPQPAIAASRQPTSVRNTDQVDIGPQPPPQSTRRVLQSEQERLLMENLPELSAVAERIYRLLPDHISFARLHSAGMAGLFRALNEFNPSEHLRFADFAECGIRDAILHSLPHLVWNAEEQQRTGKSIEMAIQELRAKLERPPTEVEICHELCIDLTAYRRLLGGLDGIEIGTLHSQRLRGSAEEDLVNLAGGPQDDWRLRAQKADMQKRLTDAIRSLPELERLVLNLSYYEGLTLKEVGLVLNESEARISQIRASAILHLRSQLHD